MITSILIWHFILSNSAFTLIIIFHLAILVIMTTMELKHRKAPYHTKTAGQYKYFVSINALAAIMAITVMFVNEYNQRYAQEYSSLFLICWMLCPLLLTGIEFPYFSIKHKTVRKKKLLGSLLLSNISIYLILFILVLLAGSVTGARRKSLLISCTSSLKQIGLAIKQYAMDNDDYLPDKSGADGLEQLRITEYLTDYGVYICPSARVKIKKGENNQKITENIVSYVYKGGCKDNDSDDSSKIPIAWDKPTNHENYGNVLFLDGHVEGFKGKNWMEQAGIKKKAIEARMTSQSQYKLNEPHYLKRFYTQKELNRILKVGISPQDVINGFGLPMIKHNHRFTYRLDFNHQISPKNKEAIVGFTVYFCDGKVVSWGMIYTSRPSK